VNKHEIKNVNEKKPAAGSLNLLRKAYGEEGRVIRVLRDYLKTRNAYVG